MNKLAVQFHLRQPAFPNFIIDTGSDVFEYTNLSVSKETAHDNIANAVHFYDQCLSDELLASHSGLVHISELPEDLARKARELIDNKDYQTGKSADTATIGLPDIGGP